MDNVNQENKSVVNPIRRQILISGATAPLVLTLFARNASADLKVGVASGAAPYSAAVKGSATLEGTTASDDPNLYAQLVSDDTANKEYLRAYYGTPGTGKITINTKYKEGSTTEVYYEYTCTWTFGTKGKMIGGTGEKVGEYAQRYEINKCDSVFSSSSFSWDSTNSIYTWTYKASDRYMGVSSFEGKNAIDNFTSAVTEINGYEEYLDE